MVKVREPDEYQKLDELMRELCAKHNLALYVTGWARKTYDVFIKEDDEARQKDLVARVESLATSNGRIYYFDDRALEFCRELGETLEKTFKIEEAELLKTPRPLY